MRKQTTNLFYIQWLCLFVSFFMFSACGPVHEKNTFDRDSTSPVPTAPTVPVIDDEDEFEGIIPVEKTFTQLRTDIFNPSCGECHSDAAENLRGGFNFDDFATVQAVIDAPNGEDTTLHDVTRTIGGTAYMPDNGPPLTLQERADILFWINSGAPNN